MARYFIFLAYNGAAYHGWQVQPNADSVQSRLQDALSILLRERTEVVGAGRTDTGVHASMMVAHFDCQQPLDCAQLTFKLNRILPHDIAVDCVKPVVPDAHARFCATSRTYHYYIHTHKNPFIHQSSLYVHYKLDFNLMNEAGKILTFYTDFAAFCKSHTDVKTTLCKVTQAEWFKVDEDRYKFVITADRFLRNMVRAVVGTLIDVGRGRVTLDEFHRIINGHSRSLAGESMPAHALFLHDITYPECLFLKE